MFEDNSMILAFWDDLHPQLSPASAFPVVDTAVAMKRLFYCMFCSDEKKPWIKELHMFYCAA